jgi:hypothetical protein
MKQMCLDSIASGHNHVQVCAEAIRKNEPTKFCFFDMEGTGAQLPYSASLAGEDVAGEDVQQTWLINPLAGGAGATLQACQVYLKNSTLNPEPATLNPEP